MKFAAITDPKGFDVIDKTNLGYHLVLAPQVLDDPEYSFFYEQKVNESHFVMLDNGAAENGSLSAEFLLDAANKINPDEVILPDALLDSEETINLTINPWLLKQIPATKRAIVPQGSDASDWLSCASFLVKELEFATLCIPKHAEKFVGGRVGLLNEIRKLGWHKTYHVHLLGIYGSPFQEIMNVRIAAPWVRGIDTAASFAHAQCSNPLIKSSLHVTHVWGAQMDFDLAFNNTLRLSRWISASIG